MDILTLRLSFTLMAAVLFGIFYFGTYRPTRSPYCGWWCLALILFVAATIGWALNGTNVQFIANPLGNAFSVGGAAAVWAAARSIRRSTPAWPALAAGPVLALLVALLSHPQDTTWPGGLTYLALVSLYFGLAAAELVSGRHADVAPKSAPAISPTLTFAAATMSVYYALRAVVYAVVGPFDWLFSTFFGGIPASLLNIVLMVVVCTTMGAMSQEQMIRDLRVRAERDHLTGLLNRGAFWTLVDRELRNYERAAVIAADLDLFKRINDLYGHGVGDHVLTTFAEAIQRSIRSSDIAARFGGEEFVIVMPGASAATAQEAAGAIAELLSNQVLLLDGSRPTVSFGISEMGPETPLTVAMQQADSALYLAKEEGRNRAVVHPADSTRINDLPSRRAAIEPPKGLFDLS